MTLSSYERNSATGDDALFFRCLRPASPVTMPFSSGSLGLRHPSSCFAKEAATDRSVGHSSGFFCRRCSAQYPGANRSKRYSQRARTGRPSPPWRLNTTRSPLSARPRVSAKRCLASAADGARWLIRTQKLSNFAILRMLANFCSQCRRPTRPPGLGPTEVAGTKSGSGDD